jgi:glucose-1-phosphate cytidylyltransferase
MKAILLAGGLGTRISEETSDKPKPMVHIARKPMLWHLMNLLSLQGIKEFVVAAGYKREVISKWAENLETEWKIEVVDTGLETQTGGRISMCMNTAGNERVLATYGDGLANVKISQLVKFHESNKTLATVTAVRPPARFGVIHSENGIVKHFGEKNQSDSGWINGGFFLLEPEVKNYIDSLTEPFETGAIPRLVGNGQLSAYHHSGFWKPMDTLRERNELELLATQNLPPWLEGIS